MTTWEQNDIGVHIDDAVTTVEIHRPPNNFFDVELLRTLAEAYERIGKDSTCRAIVLCSTGKNFCAGAHFTNEEDRGPDDDPMAIYEQGARLFDIPIPVVARPPLRSGTRD